MELQQKINSYFASKQSRHDGIHKYTHTKDKMIDRHDIHDEDGRKQHTG